MDKDNQIMEALIGNLELSIEILTKNKHYKAAESIEKAIYHLNSDKVKRINKNGSIKRFWGINENECH